MILFHAYQTILGNIQILEESGGIIGVSFRRIYPENFVDRETSTIRETFRQLSEYFAGNRKTFDLPLNPAGTNFQKKVWRELIKIPYGETRSYKQIAELIGNPKACRAIGSANNKNPIIIIIPCHRVIGATGKLIGYGGGLDRKKCLLKLEKSMND